MENDVKEGRYICIDLKSFYASVECVERGLDPFAVDLVVADPDRSKSTICLAITPHMKQQGVKNRCRVHEIPPGMEYITAKPRMRLYLEYSARIYSIYLRYAGADDIHVYSVDECFLDITSYLSYYNCSAEDVAAELMRAVFCETGITASAGVGTNLYLAKIAMDILAKHAPDHIASLTEAEYRRRLWSHEPLTDFWQIGPGTAGRLSAYGIRTMGELARTSLSAQQLLYRTFGIDAELLIDHAWGRESCTMADIKSYRPAGHSLSNGQVLMRNYTFAEARVVIREMADMMVLDMAEHRFVTDSLTVWIAYDHKTGVPHSAGTQRFHSPTRSVSRILAAAVRIFDRIARRDAGIRRLGVCAGRITESDCIQFNLFVDPESEAKEEKLELARLDLCHRYGRNAVIRCCNLLPCSTLRERNGQIGGHHA